MVRTWIAACGILISLAGHSEAADLAKIPRTIGKLPKLTSETPLYCLLVFGPNAEKRVWLVRDGDLLYVDRNGNGDLTDPGERVEADRSYSKPESGIYSFSVGDIPDTPRSHKDLCVGWFNIDHLKDSDRQAQAALERTPNFRGCSIRLDVALPDQRGAGIEGRVQHIALTDEHGFLEFSARPENAPIVHFGGPWEVTLAGEEAWRIGRTSEVVLIVGTPGIGAGTTTGVAYDKVIPAAVRPKLRVSFPPAASGGAPIDKTYELTRRCCTVNLYGDVAVPENVGTGRAKVEISLESWPGAFVAPSVHDVRLLPTGTGPKLDPISARLKSKLPHEHPTSSICGIQFSPDGKRVIAGDYPGGMIHVWETASGKRQLTLEAGEGLRATSNYFSVSPDWKTLYAPRQGKRTFERLEKDGKVVYRAAYDDSIRVWNLETGESRPALQHSPPRGIHYLKLAPDGACFFTLDDLPGEFASSRPMALSLWNAATGSHRQVLEGFAHPGAFSPDSGLVAVSIPNSAQPNYTDSLQVFALPEWTSKNTIAIGTDRTQASAGAFAGSAQLLVGTVRTYDKEGNWKQLASALKFWDVATGQEVLSVPAFSPESTFSWVKVSPDGQTVAAEEYALSDNPARVVLIDVKQRSSKRVEFSAGTTGGELAFHPSGKWLAAAIQSRTKGISNANPQDLAQPRVALIDVTNGTTVETLISPQCFMLSMAFSPDGTTLATSGQGGVLLWDFHTLPGQVVENASP